MWGQSYSLIIIQPILRALSNFVGTNQRLLTYVAIFPLLIARIGESTRRLVRYPHLMIDLDGRVV